MNLNLQNKQIFLEKTINENVPDFIGQKCSKKVDDLFSKSYHIQKVLRELCVDGCKRCPINNDCYLTHNFQNNDHLINHLASVHEDILCKTEIEKWENLYREFVNLEEAHKRSLSFQR